MSSEPSLLDELWESLVTAVIAAGAILWWLVRRPWLLGAALLGISSWARADGSPQPSKPAGPKPTPSSDSGSDFMTRLDERWRREHGDK